MSRSLVRIMLRLSQPASERRQGSIQKGGRVSRRYLGVDWADREHAVWVEDEQGTKVLFRAVAHSGEGFAEFGRWLDEQRAQGLELWAAIERRDGGVVDLLLDHGVVVYPINPKALDRARDRFRMSHAKRTRLTPGCWRRFCARTMPT